MTDKHPQSKEPVPGRSPKAEVDRLRDLFQRRWKAGERPEIEEIIEDVQSPQRTALLRELIAVEVEYRASEVDIQQYRLRFPEDLDAVEAGWATAEKQQRFETVDVSPNVDVDTGGDLATIEAAPEGTSSLIGRYEVRRVLGEGAFGEVFLAHDPQLQRSVALKVPRRKWLASAQRIDAFLNEARSAAQCKHPALVAVYDVQQDGDSVYIVQEFVDGQDLAKWATANKPSPEQVVQLMIEIAEAVGFAHQQDLVHRDLKPANILIDGHGHAHVADFGLALQESAQRLRKGEISGTPAYMSPEQVRGETHRLDGRSDIWSLGVILYEVLTGRRPFGGLSCAELSDEILHREPKPPRQIDAKIPGALERVFLKCCAKKVADRYTTATDLAADLREYLRSKEPSAPRSEGLAKGRRFFSIKSNFGPLGCTLTVTLLLLCAVVPVWFNHRAPVSFEAAMPHAEPSHLLQLEVRRGDQHFSDVSQALPLRSNDELRVRGQVAAEMHFALIWHDTDGNTQQLPVHVTDDDVTIHFVYPRQESGRPERTTFTELTGPPGTELILVCGRRDREIGDDDVAELAEAFGSGTPWPTLPEDKGLLLRPQGIEPLPSPHGPPTFTDTQGVEERAETLRRHLAEQFDDFQGIAFPHVE